jgi:hypothetical protein
MVKLIKRTIDNKFLKSLEEDLWVDDINEGFEMTYKECDSIKSVLLNSYEESALKEVINAQKTKPITKEERLELINLLTKRN